MKNTFYCLRIGVVWLWLLLTASTVFAQISQKPQLSGASSVKPNVVTIIDNSGSMLWVHAPDSFTSSFTTTIPIVSATHSSFSNQIWYNPRVRYEPRRNPDNTLMPNATELNARTVSYSVCAPEFFGSEYGCDYTAGGVGTVSFTYINAGNTFVAPPQGWVFVCNSAGTICPWFKYAPNQKVPAVGFGRYIAKTTIPTIAYSRTLTHYICTTTDTTGLCTGLKKFDVPPSSAGTSTLFYSSYPARTECTGSCTWTQERQNVLNWNLYYSNRLEAAATATGAAFADPQYDNKFRLGYGHLNTISLTLGIDDTVKRIRRGVRPFTNNSALAAGYKTEKTDFFNWLYTLPAQGGTPLNGAVYDVGQYYLDNTNTGPWSADPVIGSASPHLECRKSNLILLSDGAHNDAAKTVGNVDLAGTLPSGSSTAYVHPDTGYTFTYNVTPSTSATFVAYPDSNSNTLADLSLSYWLRDLRPDLPNRVNTRIPGRPAFWQNMVTYTIGYAVKPENITPTQLTNYQQNFYKGISTPTLTLTGVITDFLHAAVNTTGQFFNVSSPKEVKDAFAAILSDIEEQSGTDGVAVADTNGSIGSLAGELKYVPRYSTLDSSGDVDAYPLLASGSVATGTVPTWTASKKVPTPANRKLFTLSGINTPVDITTSFSALPADVRTALGSGADDSLMNYLRGTLAVARPSGGLYRLRSSLIGAAVNSAPTYVRGELNMGYTGSVVAGSDTYAGFKTNKLNNRSGMLMLTTNNGTLHAIDALNGTELMGYMPRSAMPKLQAFATEPYKFQYVFDGPSVEGDVYGTVASTTGWHNIVTGTGGRGGKFVYAIEAPVPTSSSGSGSAATPTLSNMLWEINNANANMTNLGHVLNAPISGQLRDGTWATIFGNGLYNASNQASLFIVNALTGAFIKEISTATGSAGTPNGLNGVTLIRNADRVVVAVLAGDKLGNVWKFDLSSTSPSDWKVAFGGKALFTDPNGKAITGAPAWQPHPNGGYIAVAATGILVEDTDRTDLSQKTIYGMWDKTAVGGSETATFISTLPLGSTNFLVQTSSTSTGTVSGSFSYYTVSDNAVDWTVHKGWKLDMNFAPGQRSILDVNNFGSSVVIASVVPPNASAAAESCTSVGNAEDYAYLINALTGGAAKSFDVNGDGTPDSYSIIHSNNGSFAQGVFLARKYIGPKTEYDLKGTPSQNPCVAGSESTPLLGTGTVSANAYTTCAVSGWRRSWRQLFNPPKMQ